MNHPCCPQVSMALSLIAVIAAAAFLVWIGTFPASRYQKMMHALGVVILVLSAALVVSAAAGWIQPSPFSSCPRMTDISAMGPGQAPGSEMGSMMQERRMRQRRGMMGDGQSGGPGGMGMGPGMGAGSGTMPPSMNDRKPSMQPSPPAEGTGR